MCLGECCLSTLAVQRLDGQVLSSVFFFFFFANYCTNKVTP